MLGACCSLLWRPPLLLLLCLEPRSSNAAEACDECASSPSVTLEAVGGPDAVAVAVTDDEGGGETAVDEATVSVSAAGEEPAAIAARPAAAGESATSTAAAAGVDAEEGESVRRAGK